MATYLKVKNGYRAQLNCKGIRKAKTFKLKGTAQAWAENEEHQLKYGKPKYAINHLLDDALVKYRDEVSVKKRGHKDEKYKINALRREEMAFKPIADITPEDIAKYRDRRLQAVKGATVTRSLLMLSHVFNTAIKEWGWLHENPCKMVKYPANDPPRNRRISPAEVEAICAQLTTKKQQTTAIIFRIALQTAMREGEICGIRPEHFFGCYVHLPRTKNGDARDVPLTPEAKRLVKELLKREPIEASTVAKCFALGVKKAKLKDIRFHDSRHEAAVMLSAKVDVMDLAKIGGWKDLKILLNTYYAPTASELARKLV